MAIPRCEECPLHLLGKSNCIPPTLIQRGSKRLLLVVGEKPGVEEDRQAMHFVGVVGNYFRTIHCRWLTARLGDAMPTVIATNAVRCRSETEPTASQAKRCRPHLEAEVARLQEDYDEIVVLALGGPACRSVTGQSLGECLRRQGQPIKIGELSLRVFASFNPAVLLPGRDPSLIRSIEEHLQVLLGFLTTGKLPSQVEITKLWGPVSSAPRFSRDSVISLDIETYGYIEGLPEQSVFHPEKMLAVDHVRPEDVIQTAAAAWYEGSTIKKALWVFPADRQRFISFLRDAVSRGFNLLGHNLAFDLGCIREFLGVKDFLNRDLMIGFLLDTAVASYLQNDMRQERSLKAIVALLGLHHYPAERDLSKGWRYPSVLDPELHFYNVTDAVVTLAAWFKMRELCLEHYGNRSPKFSHYCLRWFSDTIWTAIEMNEYGICYDRAKLEKLRDIKEHQAARLLRLAETWWDAALGGEGSQKFSREVVREASIASGLLGDRRLAISKKTKVISCNQDNMHLLLDNLPRKSAFSLKLRAIELFRTTRKVVDSYARPYLEEPSRGLVTNGLAYPTWFVTPSQEHEDSSTKGGTKQGRMTCSGPGRQTEPPSIWSCTTSRYLPGVVLRADSSQIELKMLAILSGDPTMMEEHLRGVDVHLATGLDIIRALESLMSSRGLNVLYGTTREWCQNILDNLPRVTKKWPGVGKWRQIGKTVNFARGFKATWHTIQKTIRRDMRIELDRPFCEGIVQAASSRYPVFTAWQDELIERAIRDGYLEVPLIGDSRTFLGGRKAIQESYVPTICNVLVQTTAARCCQSGQRVVMDKLRIGGFQTRVMENIYDAFSTDGPQEEEAACREIIDGNFSCPPFYRELQYILGRELPLSHEIKVIART